MSRMFLFCSGKCNKRNTCNGWWGFYDCSAIIDCIKEIENGGARETKIKEFQQSIRREIDVVVTAYCKENYPHICNDGESKYTSTGTIATAGRTVAVDPKFIPYGSHIEIEGVGVRVAEDCGGAIKGENRIDLLVETHQEAIEWGVQTRKATILN